MPHQELSCLIAQCMERRTQHNALIRTVNGLKLCWMSAEQEEHEFLQDLLRKTSPEIYVNNTGGCQPLEC